MRRALAAVLAVAYLVAVTAMIPIYGGSPTWLPPDPALVARWHADGERAFLDRAQQIAAQWTEADLERWNHRFNLVDAPTVRPTTDDQDISMAMFAGWYKLAARLPAAPATGTVVFADGKQRVLALQSAQEAYEAVADGGKPDCEPVEKCVSLTVIRVELTTAQVPTSRGPATVPVWAFTLRELDEPVLQVAVPEDHDPADPDIALPPLTPAPWTGATNALPPDGAHIDYEVAVRSCDQDLQPLVWESDLVVVLGAPYTPQRADACAMGRDYLPVSVTLRRPVGDRAILDVFNGSALEPWMAELR
jgi:hypothetical protein